MNATIVSAVVRHVLTAIGGGLVVKYGIDGDAVNAIVGGLSSAAGLAWSLWDKKQNRINP